MSTRMHITVDEALLARVDAARGEVPRAAWIRGAIRMRTGEAPAAEEHTPIPANHMQVTDASGTRLVPARSVVRASELESPRFKCPSCDYRSASAAAVCPRHGRRVVDEGVVF